MNFKQIKFPQKISKKNALKLLEKTFKNNKNEKVWSIKEERCLNFWKITYKFKEKPIIELQQEVGSGKTTVFQLFFEEYSPQKPEQPDKFAKNLGETIDFAQNKEFDNTVGKVVQNN